MFSSLICIKHVLRKNAKITKVFPFPNLSTQYFSPEMEMELNIFMKALYMMSYPRPLFLIISYSIVPSTDKNFDSLVGA